MKKATTQGFTLIELLVTISIIAVISAVLLVALSGARNSAYIAAGKRFAINVREKLYSDRLVYMDFDDSNGGTSFQNYGSIGGTISLASNPSWGMSIIPDTTLYNTGYQLSVPPGCAYYGCQAVMFTDNRLLAAANTLNYTMSVWYKPDIALSSNSADVMGLYGEWGAHGTIISVHTGDSSINGIIFGVNSSGGDVVASGALQLGKWTHILMSVQSVSGCGFTYCAQASLYVNGNLKSTATRGFSSPPFTNNALIIGSEAGDPGYRADGVLDDVAFYGNYVTADEVKEIYASELPKHSLALQ